ncbi:MAG: hypothetical protein K0U37_09240 [Gammaproteobacteria bacterium]|nr:hypothetical protein [Gammaproteobacteria bacterium]
MGGKSKKVEAEEHFLAELVAIQGRDLVDSTRFKELKEGLLELGPISSPERVRVRQQIYQALLTIAAENNLELVLTKKERKNLHGQGITDLTAASKPPTSGASVRQSQSNHVNASSSSSTVESQSSPIMYKIPKVTRDALSDADTVIKNARAALSRYTPGSHQQKLDALCKTLDSCLKTIKENTSISMQELIKMKTLSENLEKRLDALSFEGKGGLKEDKGFHAFYCKVATPLVALVRAVLNIIPMVVALLVGGKSRYNPIAEAVIKRPFLFQAPVSKLEKEAIVKQVSDLKALSNDVLNALDEAVAPNMKGTDGPR